MALLVVAVVMACISAWAIIRKGLAGLPLILGMWFLYADALLLIHWFPPTLAQIAVAFFIGGVSIALIAWGLYNIWMNIVLVKRIAMLDGKKKTFPDGQFWIMFRASQKPTYGVMYGLIPWNDEGANMLYEFLNEEIWKKGLKVEFFDAEHAEVSGTHCAFIMGIVRPKTIIDRILY